jgi:hypothetical protein
MRFRKRRLSRTLTSEGTIDGIHCMPDLNGHSGY